MLTLTIHICIYSTTTPNWPSIIYIKHLDRHWWYKVDQYQTHEGLLSWTVQTGERLLKATTNTPTTYTSNATTMILKGHLYLAAIAIWDITSKSDVLLFGQKFTFILLAHNMKNDSGPKPEFCSESIILKHKALSQSTGEENKFN